MRTKERLKEIQEEINRLNKERETLEKLNGLTSGEYIKEKGLLSKVEWYVTLYDDGYPVLEANRYTLSDEIKEFLSLFGIQYSIPIDDQVKLRITRSDIWLKCITKDLPDIIERYKLRILDSTEVIDKEIRLLEDDLRAAFTNKSKLLSLINISKKVRKEEF